MIWFVCKMRVQHMCTFALKNLTVKRLNKVLEYEGGKECIYVRTYVYMYVRNAIFKIIVYIAICSLV